MPIKAKYNGSYKDITELMNVDESIDYVLAKTSSSYKRVYTATRSIEDAPPTTFKSINPDKPDANLTDYRIYGQTVDGESVGDRTGNLFDGSFIHRSVIVETVGDDNPNRRSIVVDVSSYANGNKITFSRETSAGNQFQMYQVDSPLEGGKLLNSNVVSDNSKALLATITLDNISNYPYLMIFLNGTTNPITDEELLASKIMVNVGNTPLPYEPYGYKVPVTVEGKNLYKISTFRDGSTSAVVSAVTFTINNNAVSISGISSAQHPSVTSQRFELISGETYSAKIFVDGSYDGEMYIIMRGGERQDGSDEVKYKRINVGSGDTFVAKTYNSIIYVAEGTNKEFNAIVRVILIKGSMLPDTYEPYHTPITTPIYLPEQIRKVGDEAEYIDYAEQKQHRVRKNLLQNTVTSQTINGVEFTINANGSVTCNRQATGVIYFKFNSSFTLPVGEFVLTGCPTGGGNSSYRMYIQSDNLSPQKYYTDTGNGVTINNTNADTVYSARILIVAGYSCNNLTFYPMIRLASIADDTYEPYIENTDLDVTLPAQPTLPGTNVLSVGTEVQPSKIDITGHIKTISGGS